MGDKSKIEWTDATWNPVHGCSKVSPGCAHCYAETLSLRFGHTKKPWTPENAAETVILHPERLDQPLRWRKPRMVFVNSMSDLFHEQVPDDFIRRVFEVMWLAKKHTFQVLTKRPERMRDFLTERFADPLPNVWLGVSIENRQFITRADILRDTPVAVRFISAEPLLGPLVPRGPSKRITGFGDGPFWDWRGLGQLRDPGLDLTDIDWLIVGGESGGHHRNMEADWVRDLRDETMRSDPEVAFFFKQWGGRTPKAGGRELDGRTWDEMPTSELEVVG